MSLAPTNHPKYCPCGSCRQVTAPKPLEELLAEWKTVRGEVVPPDTAEMARRLRAVATYVTECRRIQGVACYVPASRLERILAGGIE